MAPVHRTGDCLLHFGLAFSFILALTYPSPAHGANGNPGCPGAAARAQPGPCTCCASATMSKSSGVGDHDHRRLPADRNAGHPRRYPAGTGRSGRAACGPDGDAGNAVYDAMFTEALAQARERWPGVDAIAFGDLFCSSLASTFTAMRRARKGLAPWYPLFGSDRRVLAREMVAGGLRVARCCVDTRQLDPAWAGREYDAALLDGLPWSTSSGRPRAAHQFGQHPIPPRDSALTGQASASTGQACPCAMAAMRCCMPDRQAVPRKRPRTIAVRGLGCLADAAKPVTISRRYRHTVSATVRRRHCSAGRASS